MARMRRGEDTVADDLADAGCRCWKAPATGTFTERSVESVSLVACPTDREHGYAATVVLTGTSTQAGAFLTDSQLDELIDDLNDLRLIVGG